VAYLLIAAVLLLFFAVKSSAGEPLFPGSDPGILAKAQRMKIPIATAEGYYRTDNPKPKRYFNPGSLVDPSTKDLYRYPDEATGFAKLEAYLVGVLSEQNSNYNLGMSFREFGSVYIGWDGVNQDVLDNWVWIVSSGVNATPDTTLQEYLYGYLVN
jgi:hypothetical protein